jgi:gamma-glutamyltranspeptidase / glutathione hydrolase
MSVSLPDYRPLPSLRPAVIGKRYVVASGHHLASMAGIRVLERGGNVVDAGVAAGLCLNVVQPDMAGLGGVAPIMFCSGRTGEVMTISGVGRWPKAGTLDEIQRRGGDLTDGVLSLIVPAALDAWILALREFGTMSFGEVARSAIELAEDGFAVNHFLHRNLHKAEERMARWPSTRAVFLHRGRVPGPGERLVQRDLARTLQALGEAEGGAASRHEGLTAVRDLYYKGQLARRMASFCEELGSFLTYDDLSGFAVKMEPALRTSYRGYEVYACGPWCQGPVVLQALNILEGYDMAGLPPASAPALHLVVEALKAAFADRHAYYGDPEFVQVPVVGLLSKEYAATWRERIRQDRATPGMPAPGNPWLLENGQLAIRMAEPRPIAVSRHHSDTTYVCVGDSDGNAFSATPSDDVTGSPLVPGLGFAVSPRGHQFWLEPEHPSCVAPGKRPRLTPSPGLVMRQGRCAIVYGTPGLDVQPQAMVQFLVHAIDHGMGVMEAIEAPRVATYSFPGSMFPHPYEPGLLRAEARVTEAVCSDLSALGHRVESWPDWTPQAGGLCAITFDHEEGFLAGGADPRRLAYAIGW